MEISVVICSYNRARYIGDALQSMTAQMLDPQCFEAIVVDNNSTDGTEGVVKAFIDGHPGWNLRYLSEGRQGASFARNTGAAQARGSLLVFMDDDALAEPDYLSRIRATMAGHPQAAGMGGRIIPRYIPSEPRWMSYYVSSLVGHYHYSDELTPFAPGKYPLESNMVVRKEAFDAIGGFDSRLPGVQGTLRIGGEGKDFFLRLQALGRPVIYDPKAVVHHVVEVDKLTPEYMYRVASGIGRGERVRTRAKGKGPFLKKIGEYTYKLGGAAVLGLGYALRGRPAQTWPVIKFRIDAMKGLLGY